MVGQRLELARTLLENASKFTGVFQSFGRGLMQCRPVVQAHGGFALPGQQVVQTVIGTEPAWVAKVQGAGVAVKCRAKFFQLCRPALPVVSVGLSYEVKTLGELSYYFSFTCLIGVKLQTERLQPLLA